LDHCQGDQIRRIFANWASVYFVQFFYVIDVVKIFYGFLETKSVGLLFFSQAQLVTPTIVEMNDYLLR
jgi:hypothetical protein